MIRDFRPDVQAYIDGVLNGSITVGRLVRLAVERHVDDLENAGERGYRFDADAANLAINFFPMVLRHSTDEFAGERGASSAGSESTTARGGSGWR